MAAPLLGAIGAIAGAVGSQALQTGANMLVAKQNFKYSKDLQERQYNFDVRKMRLENAWNIDQWNRENEYNNYVNQVQRMKDAGLNVGMMMGSQQLTNAPALESANPSTPPAPIADFMRSPNFGESLTNVLNYDLERKKMELQDKMLDKSLRRTDRDLDIKDRQVTSVAELNSILGRKAESEIDLNRAEEDKVRKTIDVCNKNIEVMDEQIVNYRAQSEQYLALAEKAKEERNYLSYNAITARMQAQSQRIIANATKDYYQKLGKQAESTVKLNEQNVKNLVSALAKTDQETRNLRQTFEFNGKSFAVDLQIKKGQFKLLNLQAENQEVQNELAKDTYYAQVADAYINTVSNAANAVSDCTAAVVDVSTAGATTVLRGKGAVANQKAQTGLYNSGTKLSSFSYGL